MLSTNIFQKSTYLLLLCIIVGLISTDRADATNTSLQDLRFEHITTQDGLISDVSTTIIQDYRGFIWVGTEAGLSCYDGINFKNYSTSSPSNIQLSNDVIRCLYEDSRHNIWVGTEYGLTKIDQLTGETMHHTRDQSSSISNNIVTSVCEDLNGNLWVGTQNGLNLLKVDSLKNSVFFEKLYHNPTDKNSIANNKIYSMFCDSKGNMWICTEGGGISVIYAEDIKINNFTFHTVNQKSNGGLGLSSNVAYKLVETKKGIYYAATDQGLNQIVYQTGQHPKVIRHYSKDNTKTNWLADNRIFSLLVDKDDKLWLGTYSNGLYLYDDSNDIFFNFNHDPLLSKSISRSFVNHIYQSRDGIIWTSNAGCGIDKVNLNNLKMQHLTANPAEKPHLSNSIVKSIIEDKKGQIWMGTNGGGVNIYNPKSHKIKTLKKENTGKHAASNTVQAITYDNNGTFWIGTMGSGLVKYNPKSLETTYHTTADKGISNDFIWALKYSETLNTLLIGTHDGLSHYNINEKKFYNFKHIGTNPHSINCNYIRALHEASDSNLWIGTYGGGINIIKTQELKKQRKAKFKHLTHNINDKNSLSSDLVNSIYEDSQKQIWIATQQGLNLYQTKTNNFKTFSVKDGLPDNVIKAVLEDNEGQLWISTQNGISRFNTKSKTFTNFSTDDGLPSNIFNLSSALKTSDGKMYFGSITGVCHFFPQTITSDSVIYPTIISELLINGKAILPNQELNGRTLLSESIYNCTEITLKHNENNLTFAFTSPMLASTSKNTYLYMLEGVDKEWRTTSHNNKSVTYNKLPDNSYCFRVKAIKDSGIEGQEASIIINVKKHPFLTYYAIIAYLLILIIVIYYGVKISKDQYKVKHELLIEKEHSKRQEELSRFKYQFFTNISHELRTPLTLISGPLQKIKDQIGSNSPSTEYLNIIEKHSKMMLQLINQLLDFQKASNKKLKLNIAESDIVLQLNNITNSFKEYAQEKNIYFNFTPPCEQLDNYYDHDKIDKVLYNLVSNAFKYTPTGGAVSISLSHPVNKAKWEDDALRAFGENSIHYPLTIIRVKDTGIGIKDHDNRIFERFFQSTGNDNLQGTGIGLAYASQLMKTHKGFIGFDSILGKGTNFYIAFPSERANYPKGSLVDDQTFSITNSDINELSQHITLDKKTSSTPETKTKSSKLLIIEDNPDVINFIEDIFRENYEVHKAENGKDGFEIALTISPDIIISDIMMPVMNGLELCQLVKGTIETNHIPLILLTAKNDIAHEIEGFEHGADAYIKKPFDIIHLQTMVKNLLDSRRTLQEKYKTSLVVNPNELKNKETPNDIFIKKVVNCIENNLSNSDYSVEKLAENVNISSVHLYRKLKAITGMTTVAFIRDYKMKKAAQLITEKELRISEACYEVGFSDPKYFRKCFKQVFDISPTDYITKYKTKR